MIIDLADCDVVFLSFDEPNADENFALLTNVLPRAKRVHGVVGFDAAHRQAGATAATPQVITIDADNVIVDETFLNSRFEISPRDLGCVFSFSARNVLNGLEYGNGGVKLWPREALLGLQTHENAGRAEAAVDFCWTVPYYQVNRVLSEVRMTSTPQQAFRGGFREGVKFNLGEGTSAYEAYPDLSRAEALPKHIGAANFERLRVWCSVGADIENGDWAIFGARLGCAMTALEGFNPSHVADYVWFSEFWSNEILPKWQEAPVRLKKSAKLREQLNEQLELRLETYTETESISFKSNYRTQRAYGPMSVV